MSLEKRKKTKIEEERIPEYDIYIAGPWEKYQKEAYKTLIKEAFPNINIYDPEDYQDGDYFQDDLEVISRSKYLVCYAATFPNSASNFEAGYFYHIQEKLGLLDKDLKSKKIIVIWDEDIQPNHGRKWYERATIVVSNTKEAIAILKELEPEWSLDRP